MHIHSAKPPPCPWVGRQSGERRAGYLTYPILICITSYGTLVSVKPAFKDSSSPGSQHIPYISRLLSQLSPGSVKAVSKLLGTWFGAWQRAP